MQTLIPLQSPTASNPYFSLSYRMNGDLLSLKKHAPSFSYKTQGVDRADHVVQIAMEVESSELFELKTQAKPLETSLETPLEASLEILPEMKEEMEMGKLLETMLVTRF